MQTNIDSLQNLGPDDLMSVLVKGGFCPEVYECGLENTSSCPGLRYWGKCSECVSEWLSKEHQA